MKIKYLLIFVVLAVLIPAAVYAMESQVFVSAASWGQPFEKSFVTNRDGDVTVNAKWEPKAGSRYVLTVRRLADPNDIFSYTHICQVYEPLNGQGSGQTVGDYTCSWSNAPAGYWLADFKPVSGGKVKTVTLTITAETD